jgi:hypothetical protein
LVGVRFSLFGFFGEEVGEDLAEDHHEVDSVALSKEYVFNLHQVSLNILKLLPIQQPLDLILNPQGYLINISDPTIDLHLIILTNLVLDLCIEHLVPSFDEDRFLDVPVLEIFFELSLDVFL